MSDIPLPILGIDLLADETQLRAGAVRSAVNVDIGNSGAFKRRDGYTVVDSTDSFTGIHAFNGVVYVGMGTNLCRLNTTTYALTVICGMGTEAPIEFTEYNGDLYVCGPRALWRITGGVAKPVGVQIPSLPTAVPHASGTLTPGRYGVAISIVDASGEESPAVMLGYLNLTAGLRLEALPVVADHKWRVYVTPPDGDVLYLAEEFDAMLSQYAVTVYPGGAPCQTLNLHPMPPGDFVCAKAGRLYVAAGDTLWFSEALRPHLTSPRHNFVRFVGRIRFVELVEGGAFVGDDRGVWWMAGTDPSGWAQSLVSSSLAVRRSSLIVPAEDLPGDSSGDCAVWLSTQGYMVGAPGGSVRPLQPGRIKLSPDLEGRSVFITRDGIKQVITLTAASPATSFGVALDTSTQ